MEQNTNIGTAEYVKSDDPTRYSIRMEGVWYNGRGSLPVIEDPVTKELRPIQNGDLVTINWTANQKFKNIGKVLGGVVKPTGTTTPIKKQVPIQQTLGFDGRQTSIERQSALKSAVAVFTGQPELAKLLMEKETETVKPQLITMLADQFYDWIRRKNEADKV